MDNRDVRNPSSGCWISNVHKLRIRVYYDSTDAGGIVYHSQYLSFAEHARTESLRLCGINQINILENQGVADNTVIIYSSDNGFFNGSHGLGSKVLPYEEGARVPLMILDPRVPESLRGRRTSALSGNIDITATIMDLAGIGHTHAMDGRSLMPMVRGKAKRVRDRYL